jgi:hypothetical protein
MKWFKPSIFITLAITLVLGSLLPSEPRAQVRTEHPRIWLTDELKATLSDRMARNTRNAQRLQNWCDSHMNDNFSSYIDSRALGTLKAINFALLYQLDKANNGAYAARAIQIIDYIYHNPYSSYTIDSWLAFDAYYNSRYLMSGFAIVYDWCYDYMTQAQRDLFMNQMANWANTLITGVGFSWRDPSNNFYYGHMWALLTTGYALYGHHPDAQSWINEARGVMMVEGIKYSRGEIVAWSTWDNNKGRANGGMWNEGTAYGNVDTAFLCSAILAAQSAEGLEYPEFVFPNETIMFHLYATYPTGTQFYAEGDDAGVVPITPKTRIPVLFAIRLASDETMKRYGQYWINHCTQDTYYDYKLYNEFIWYDDQQPETDYGQAGIPNHFYMDGTMILFWRDGWGPNDCWMTFRIGVNNTDHGMNGFGNFIIYKNGHIISDKAADLDGRFLTSDLDHNCLYIPLVNDRRMFWGHSVIEHWKETDEYLYLAGDMSDCYLAQPSYRENTVEHKEREFFFLTNEKAIVVMDRGSSFNASHDKIFQVYFHSQATPSGGDYRTTNGHADVVIHTAHPAGVAPTLDSNGLPRFRVITGTTERAKTFLHVFKMTDPGGGFQTTPVSVSGANVVGAAFSSDNALRGYLFTFSNDTEGDAPTEDGFSMTLHRFRDVVRLYALNLPPQTQYYISRTIADTDATVNISKNYLTDGIARTTDDDGILTLDIQLGEAPLPTLPPSGVEIDSP